MFLNSTLKLFHSTESIYLVKKIIWRSPLRNQPPDPPLSFLLKSGITNSWESEIKAGILLQDTLIFMRVDCGYMPPWRINMCMTNGLEPDLSFHCKS